ncbi:7364_t:CDS:2 [Paraglomus occultum]|uniref:7364_t:CDS:1 n=1 Tax=Paraglomus occultum TaxID=144539 RepID=A0A9N9CAP8_9GLOM|nr:7364_t:CDS:2 [Paraglomus occultum]
MLNIFFFIALFLSTVLAVPSLFESKRNSIAPLISFSDAKVIPDQFIVKLKDDVSKDKITTLSDDYPGITHTYEMPGFKGFAGKFSEQVLKEIRQRDDVAFVETDQQMQTSAVVVQPGEPWGLARISHRAHILNFVTYSQYAYNPIAGENTTVYVLDTGINIKHTDFGGRARWGITIPAGEPNKDNNGHGTHVAGTIAGFQFGVAKRTKVVAVKVFPANGVGPNSDVIKGIEWAVNDHKKTVANAKKKGLIFKGSVINMSLGGNKSIALDTATNAAVDAGVPVVVAAGNGITDACQKSPSGAEKAIAAGSTTQEDSRSWFSNFGCCVDIWAPGSFITSAWIGSKTATMTLSGTSQSSAHVSGLAAYFLALSAKPLTPHQLRHKLISVATRNLLTDIRACSPNRLAYNDIGF